MSRNATKLQLHERREDSCLAMRDSCPVPKEHRKPRGVQWFPGVENPIRRSTVGKKDDEVLWFCRCDRQGIGVEGRHNCLPDLLGVTKGRALPTIMKRARRRSASA
jgi:hypothetical protein